MSGPDPLRLRSYLLGRLTEDEAEALEKEYFTDPESRERMAVEEDELFDAYAADRLSDDDRRRFEARYLSSEEGRGRAALSEALLAAGHTPAAPAKGRAAWPSVAAAAVAASLALAGWAIHRQRRAEEELRRLGEAVQQLSSREAEWRRRFGETLPPQASGGPAPVDTPARVATLVLAAGLQRDGQPAPTLRLAPGTRSVRLSLRARPEWTYQAYEARLETPDGREVARVKAPPVQRAPAGHFVEVLLPAASLGDGTHVLFLQGRGPSSAEDLASFVFQVARD